MVRFFFPTMVPNHVRLILIQVTILVISGSQGQQFLNNNNGAPATLPRAKFFNPPAVYYPPYGTYPYQYPGYGYGYQFAYPSQPVGGAPYPRPSSFVRPSTGSGPIGGSQPLQEYYLGPMNAAQARYLIAYVQSLMRYGNTTITAPQIPSTPTQIQPSTPTPTVPPLVPNLNTSTELTPTSNSTTINSFEASSSPTLNNSSEPFISTPIPPEFSTPDVRQSTPPISVPQNISTLLLNNTTDKSENNSVDESITAPPSPVSESGGDILRSAQVQFDNPFVSNFAYPAESGSDWLYSYNPAVTSFYGNLPPSQPFYPPGFGPRNPFVLSPPAPLPALQTNGTQQGNPTSPQSRQASTFEASTTEDTAGGGGGLVTNMEDLPPQVKEFIKMIPSILSMQDTSQLSPSNNNAIVHRIVGGLNGADMGVRQFGGGSARGTPVATNLYDQQSLQRFKKRRMKMLRRHGHNCFRK